MIDIKVTPDNNWVLVNHELTNSDLDPIPQDDDANSSVNRLIDGYPCYHRECDTMETMIEYMDTDDSTGINNLVHSWDIVTWWAVYAFLHMDQTPVPNEL